MAALVVVGSGIYLAGYLLVVLYWKLWAQTEGRTPPLLWSRCTALLWPLLLAAMLVHASIAGAFRGASRAAHRLGE